MDSSPRCERMLRDAARAAIRGLLWLLPAVFARLALRGGMGWELVTLLGVLIAGAGSASGRGGRGRLVLALCLGLGCGLLLGAGHGTLAAGGEAAVVLAALVLGGALGDRRALLALVVVLLGLVLLNQAPATAVALVAAALAVRAGQVRLRRMGQRRGRRVSVVPPAARPGGKVWSVGAAPAPLPAVLVQAERAADGTLRVALATGAAGRMRVTVC